MTDNSHLNQYEQLLISPQERLDVEIKTWLDISAKLGQAKLAKAICALANHGGGIVLVGLISEDKGVTYKRDENNASWLSQYTPDAVNGISNTYLEPAIHCDVKHIKHPVDGHTYPLISVPPSSIPVIIKKAHDEAAVKQGVYIRRSNISSDEPKTADEWRMLISRCVKAGREDLLGSIRLIIQGIDKSDINNETQTDSFNQWISGAIQDWDSKNKSLADTNPAKIKNGHYWVAYKLEDTSPLSTTRDLLNVLHLNQLTLTGWPVWLTEHNDQFRPRTNEDGELVCWLGGSNLNNASPAHADYWKYTKDGKAFLGRGFDEDKNPYKEMPLAGTISDFTLPIWRIGEALLHAAMMAQQFGNPNTNVLFKVKWQGLKGRTLTSIQRPHALSMNYTAYANEAKSECHVPASVIVENLPEVVSSLLKPFYEKFEWVIPDSVVIAELNALRKRAK